MIALAIGSGDCGLYYRDWNGSSWTNWALVATCYKQVSSFSTYTGDGGAYMLLLDTNNLLHTNRFTGSVWSGIRPPDTQTPWLAAAGLNIDDDTGNVYEHTQTADDCRVSSFLFGPVCDSHGNCFYAQGVNLAEIIYNEAAGETLGAQDAVGWTVRDRAFEGLSDTKLCGSYVGAETGGTVTATCRANVQCNAPGLCDNTPRYCCVMHGGQFRVGTSGYQFDDEHVDMDTLTSSGVMFEAELVGTGLVPDISTSWCPSGIGQCYFDCLFPDSDQFISNYSEPSPHGPMEFQSSVYPLPNPSCQQAPTANTCPGGATNSVCCNASPNNYFWNRK